MVHQFYVRYHYHEHHFTVLIIIDEIINFILIHITHDKITSVILLTKSKITDKKELWRENHPETPPKISSQSQQTGKPGWKKKPGQV